MRRRASRRLVESRVPSGQRIRHHCARLVQSRQVFVHLMQETLTCSSDRLTLRTTTVAGLQERRERHRWAWARLRRIGSPGRNWRPRLSLSDRHKRSGNSEQVVAKVVPDGPPFARSRSVMAVQLVFRRRAARAVLGTNPTRSATYQSCDIRQLRTPISSWRRLSVSNEPLQVLVPVVRDHDGGGSS
jgi:hypothetical protein